MYGEAIAEIQLHGNAALKTYKRLAVEGRIGESEPRGIITDLQTEFKGFVCGAMLVGHSSRPHLAIPIGNAQGEGCHVVRHQVQPLIVYQVGIVLRLVVGRFEACGDCQCGHSQLGKGFCVGGRENGVLIALGAYRDVDPEG